MNNVFVMLYQWTQWVSRAVSRKDPPCRLMSDITLRLHHVKSVLGQQGEIHSLGTLIQEPIQVGAKRQHGLQAHLLQAHLQTKWQEAQVILLPGK